LIESSRAEGYARSRDPSRRRAIPSLVDCPRRCRPR